MDVVEDPGQSAKSLNRPGLNEVLQRLRNGEADGVVVAKLDRLTRSVKDLGNLVDGYFGKDGSDLISVAETVDTRSAAGRLVLNVLASVAQWEREAIGERTREALQHLRASGVPLGGRRLGWRWTEAPDGGTRKTLEPIEEEQATLHRILELRGAGLSVRRIAATLEEEGRRTISGARWHPTTVQRVLTHATC